MGVRGAPPAICAAATVQIECEASASARDETYMFPSGPLQCTCVIREWPINNTALIWDIRYYATQRTEPARSDCRRYFTDRYAIKTHFQKASGHPSCEQRQKKFIGAPIRICAIKRVVYTRHFVAFKSSDRQKECTR